MSHQNDHPWWLPPSHGALPSHRQTPHPRQLSLRTINICDGRGSRLVQATRILQIRGFRLIVQTKTNITDKAYCCNRMGYDVVCLLMITTAASTAQGGVFLVIRKQPQGYSVESTCFHVPNVVSCEVITSTNIKWILIIGS